MQTDYKKSKIKDTDHLVSRRLKERRLMLGISLKEVGNLTGVNISTIQKYEKYTDHLSNRKLLKLMKFSKSSLDYIFKVWLIIYNIVRRFLT